MNSEKYELRPRDFAARRRRRATRWSPTSPGSTRSAARTRRCSSCATSVPPLDNDQIIAYSKTDPATGDTVLVVINLDPWNAQVGNTALDLPALGFDWGDTFTVHDEITGGTWQWGQFNFVALQPWDHVAHIFAVRP